MLVLKKRYLRRSSMSIPFNNLLLDNESVLEAVLKVLNPRVLKFWPLGPPQSKVQELSCQDSPNSISSRSSSGKSQTSENDSKLRKKCFLSARSYKESTPVKLSDFKRLSLKRRSSEKHSK